MFVYYVYALLEETRKGHWIPGTEVIDGCRKPCGGWELNDSPLEEHPVLLTAELQPPILFFFNTKGIIYKIIEKQGFIKSKKENFSFEKLSTMRE